MADQRPLEQNSARSNQGSDRGRDTDAMGTGRGTEHGRDTAAGRPGEDRPGRSGQEGAAEQTARDLKGTAQDTIAQAKQAAQEAKRTASEVGRELSDQASRVREEVAQNVRSAATQTRDRAADELRGVAHALHAAGNELSGRESDPLARAAHVAADRVGGLADYLASCEPREMLDDAQRFARRHPEWVLGSVLVGGFLLGRFLKASERRDRSAGDGTLWDNQATGDSGATPMARHSPYGQSPGFPGSSTNSPAARYVPGSTPGGEAVHAAPGVTGTRTDINSAAGNTGMSGGVTGGGI